MLDSDTIVTFSKDVVPGVELKSFWPPEDGFVWSAGRWCDVMFDYAVQSPGPRDRAELVFDMDAFKSPPEMEAQNVFFYLNGLRVGARRLTKRVTAFIEIDPSVLKATNIVTIDTPDATAPARFSGKDERVLGIKLFTLQVRYFASA